MKRLSVFLSSAMTGELDSERDGVRILFDTDQVLKEFFELYVIEEHASPQPIERAFIKEVRQSELLILLLDKQLRDAVEKGSDPRSSFQTSFKQQISILYHQTARFQSLS